MRGGLRGLALPVGVATLLAAGLLVQLRFLDSHRQPTLFGDALSYYRVGERLQEAVAEWRRGAGADAAFEKLRPVAPLAGVGAVYAALDAGWPGDEHAFRVAFAVVNTLGMLAAFFLARSLAGSGWAGVLALVFAVVHPSQSVQTARLLPDPVTGALWTWAAFFYVEGVRRGRGWWMGVSGLALGAGLFVRTQLIVYVPALAALALLPFLPRLLAGREGRRRLAWFLAGCLPLPLLWAASLRATRGDLSAIEQLGNFGYRQWYPYGFWQHLETDGWMGPYRLKTEPYYEALAAAAEGDRDLLRSRRRQLLFTARYVASRPAESMLTVLDNVYRTYDRPPNDYQVDYPYRYPFQVAAHRLILVLGIAGAAVFTALRPAWAGAFLVPVGLALIHGLAYPWPRFAQPALWIWIASAAAFVAWAAARVTRARTGGALLPALGAGCVLAWLASGLLADAQPELAYALRVVAALAALALPFGLAWRLLDPARPRWLAAAAWALLAVVVLGHARHDRLWHGTAVTLDEGAVVEQEIVLPAEAVASLRDAREVFVAVDALPLASGGDTLVIEAGGRPLASESTLPRLGDSVVARWRPRWRQRQWHAVRFDTAGLPPSGPFTLRVGVRAARGRWRVFGDRFHAQQTLYEGPSFGEWPRLAAAKLEYDGDYRLPARYPLRSMGSRSLRLDAAGRRTALRSVLRIRLLALAGNEGRVSWQSAPVPRAAAVAFGFAAYAGDRGSGSLAVEGEPVLTFPLDGGSDFDLAAGARRLCYRAEGRRGDKPYGAYFLLGPGGRGARPATLEVRFASGMSVEPMRFIVDTRRDPAELAALLGGCEPPPGTAFVNGAARLVDARHNSYPEDTGRWTVAAVY